MSVGLNKASIFAIKKEAVPGEYAAPTVGADFVPLRPGNELTYEPDTLQNDELLNDIGATKSFIGKEAVSGKHTAFLKHSGIEGQAPQLAPLYESVMGLMVTPPAEIVTLAGSTTSVIKLPVGEGANQFVGKAVLVKDATNGYAIRNIKSIVGDDVTLNFALNNAPAVGIGLGRPVTFKPAAQGHPAFSTTKYLGNGFAKEVSAGNQGTEISLTADANGFGEVEFSFEGTRYYYNPVIVDVTNKTLVTSLGTVTVPERVYRTPIEIAESLELVLKVIDATATVKYDNAAGKFTINGAFDITGAGSTILPSLGYTVADKTPAPYISESQLSYAAPVSPVFDNADPIVIKNCDLMVGTGVDNVNVAAQSVKITIGKETEDVDNICAETGIDDKIPTGRTVEMACTITLKKHQALFLDALLKNKGLSAMLNAGPKVAGNWVGGKCFNIYLETCTVSKFATTGDSFLQAELTLKGYVSSSTKDAFINFV
jgi:hypothetical protein